jgi:hypothetical protein
MVPAAHRTRWPISHATHLSDDARRINPEGRRDVNERMVQPTLAALELRQGDAYQTRCDRSC